MTEKALVSIVTPVYNGEAHIGRLLRSVLAQDCPSIEMILVDDGSTDGTAAAAEGFLPRFAAKGYSLQIVRAAHKNASAAINAGLCHVTGKYLIWPDADDELLPGSVKKRVEFLETHPGYSGVRSVMEYVSEETGAVLPPQEALGDLTKEQLFWDVLEGRTFVCSGCYMLRTEAFFAAYPEKRIPVSDAGQNFQMLLPFLLWHRCPTLPQKLYRVYLRPGSHSRQKRTEAEETHRYRLFEQLADEIFAICRLTGDPAAADRLARWKAARRADLARRYRHAGRFLAWKLAAAWFWMKSILHGRAAG